MCFPRRTLRAVADGFSTTGKIFDPILGNLEKNN
jgi:hypothetical protein